MKRIALHTLVVALIAPLAACVSTPLKPPLTGYACCNLHTYYGDWVSTHNVLGGSMIPAGAAASFNSIKKNYYVYGSLDGRDFGLRNDYGHGEQETLRWAHEVIVTEDPRIRLATWSPEVQAAVHAGRVMAGMTKPQVLMALGYPDVEDTPKLEAATWRYWVAKDDQPVDLHFGDGDKLVSFAGKPAAVKLVQVEQ